MDRDNRRPPLPVGPEIPEWVDIRDLDPGVRAALRGLDPRNADRVAAHLVAAGTLVDEDPDAALEHARAARDRASRVGPVREAVGVAAYHAGDYAEAARELRAYRRMSGDSGYRAVLADCERALGRAEIALRLVTEALAGGPDAEETVELRLVEAGARRDLGEIAAARLVLEDALGGRPRPDILADSGPGSLRLGLAYADLLRAEGDEALADQWVEAVAEIDPDLVTAATGRVDVEFTEIAIDDDADESVVDSRGTLPDDAVVADAAGGAAVEPVEPVDETSPGLTFDEEVEAEVAELLGETSPDGGSGDQSGNDGGDEPRD